MDDKPRVGIGDKLKGGTTSDDFIDSCILRIANGDKETLKELYEHVSPAIYGFVMSTLKNPQDAEDVLQDCFIKIYTAAETYKSKGKPMAWIYTIARNLCIQRLRDCARTADIAQEDWSNYIFANENVSNDDRLILNELLENLSETDRQIVVMHAVSGLKHKEIAKILELPLSTVLSKYKRSLEKLYKRLMDDEDVKASYEKELNIDINSKDKMKEYKLKSKQKEKNEKETNHDK